MAVDGQGIRTTNEKPTQMMLTDTFPFGSVREIFFPTTPKPKVVRV